MLVRTETSFVRCYSEAKGFQVYHIYILSATAVHYFLIMMSVVTLVLDRRNLIESAIKCGDCA